MNIYVGNLPWSIDDESLEKLFAELKSNSLTKGIIKIDVEGCEFSILKGIAKVLPSDFSFSLTR